MLARIYFASHDADWKKKIVEKLRDVGLDYSVTDDWQNCEIIIVDLGFKKGRILKMMAERRGVCLEEPPPVIIANPGRADVDEAITCVCEALMFEPPIIDNNDDIVKFIRWFDYFLPRKAIARDARETAGHIAKIYFMKPRGA